MARKSLIPPGSVFGQAENPAPEPDLMARVIDRHRSKLAANQLSKESEESERITGNTVTDITGNTLAKTLNNPSEKRTPFEILEEIRAASTGRTKAVTFKVDTGIDDYLTRFVHEHWRDGAQKSSILERALRLWMYEQETGRDLVDFGDGE